MPINREELKRIFRARAERGSAQVKQSEKELEVVNKNNVIRRENAKAQEFNPVNALVAGGSAYLASGGNPLAAGAAALGSARGKDKPLESIAGGGVTGLTTGADLKIEDLAKPENAAKLATIAKQAKLPKNVTSSLDTYAKGQALLTKATAEKEAKAAAAKAKKESEALKAENEKETLKIKQKNAIELANVKAKLKVGSKTAKRTDIQNNTYLEAMNSLKTSIKKYSNIGDEDKLEAYIEGYKRILDESFAAGELTKQDYKEIIKLIEGL